MSRVFVTKTFDRWLGKSGLKDSDLLVAISDADSGLSGKGLGGTLTKIRIAREGRGKSSGHRTIVAYKQGDKAFFLYGFSKNEKENIPPYELDLLKTLGASLQALTDKGIETAIANNVIRKL